MRTKTNLLLASAIIGICLAGTPRALATDGKWNADASDNWSAASRWTNNQIADGIGATANIAYNITAARTVTLDTPRTVGKIRFNDDTTSSHDWTLAASGGSVLTLQVVSGSPTIDSGNRTVNFNAPFTGNQGFTKVGSSTLILNTASNNFSGKVYLNAGTTRFLSGYTIGPEPETYQADAITINTGTLMNHNPNTLVIGPTRGITLGASGGYLLAGWTSPVIINSVITGSGGLTLKSDVTPGPISLNGDNTYTGPTVIGNSTANNSWCWALINGSLSASSAVSVRTNGSLGGTGIINGPVTVTTNGLIGPGGIFQAGTLTVNNSLTATNGFLTFDLATVTTEGAGVNDLLQVNGNLTLKGTITVQINALAGSLANGTYRLINYTGTGDFADCTLVCENPRYGATFDTSTPGQVNMTIANGTPVNLVWQGSQGLYWDIGVTTNFLNGLTPDVFYQGDSVRFDDSGSYLAPVTLLAVGPNIGMVQPSSVIVNTTNSFTLTSGGSARLGGSMGLYKGGTGTLTLGHANNNNPHMYTGPTVVTNGMLTLANGRALGSLAGATIVSNGATLNVNGLDIGFEPIFVEGEGVDGAGAIVNLGGGQNNALRVVTMTGNTTVGGTGRFDIRNLGGNAYLNTGGNPYKLTKKGANQFTLVGVATDSALGDIDVLEGTFGYETTSTLGDPAKTLTLGTDTSLRLWNLSNDFYKPLVLNGGTRANIDNGSGTNTIVGPVTLAADSIWNINAGSLAVYSGIIGAGGLTKVGSQTLYLYGTNTYAGSTLLNAGGLTLGPNAALPNTPLLNVPSGTTLDVSQIVAGLSLGAGQTLAGAGSILGNINAGAGSILAPGGSPGTLTINGSLGLTNAALEFELGASPFAAGSDQISALGVTAAGINTLKLRPLASLDTANPYTLIVNGGAPMPSGTETNFTITTDSRYSFLVLPTDTGFGYTLQVQAVGTPSALLTWQGADAVNPTFWDLKTTANWLNGATVDTFYAGDSVVFDDTAIGTTINLIGTVDPSSIVFNNLAKAITIQGAGSLVTAGLGMEGGGTATLANDSANKFVYGITNNAGSLVIANNAPNDYGLGIAINGGKVVLDQPLAVTLSAPLSGTGTLEKANTNTLTLSAASTGFGGSVTVNNGILRTANGSALGDTAGQTTINPGGTLDVNGINLGNEIVNVRGPGFGGQGAIINTGAGQNNALHDVVLTGDTTFGGPNRWDIRSASMSPAGTLSMQGGAAFNLVKVSASQFSLVNVAVDPALADIDVQGGVFSYEAGTTGLGNPASTLTIRSNATLLIWSSTVPLNKRIALANASTVRAGSGTGNQVTGPVELAGGSANLGAASSCTLYFFGPISGSGGITKTEPGSVHLIASNAFEGDVVVGLGNLVLSNSYAAGTNKTVVVNYNTTVSGGTGTRLYLRGGITTPESLVGLFRATSYGGDYRCSITADSLTNTWTGPMLLEGSGIVGFYGGAGTNVFNLTGPILGTNGFTGTAFFRGTAGLCGTISGKVEIPTGTLAITDNTSWQFSNPANDWSLTSIAYGRILLGADNAVDPTAPLSLGQSGSSSGTLDLNGFNQTVPALSTVNGSNHWITNGSATADSVFTFDGGTNSSTLDGRIVDNIRKLSLTVSSGSLTLLGNNTYRGDTLISGGRLVLGAAGTLAGTPRITLAAGGTLDTSTKGTSGLTLASGQTLAGTGTIDGSLTVAPGSTLSAGTSIGTLTVTNVLTLQGTNVAEVNTGASPSSDLVNAGVVLYGGTLVVNNLGPALAVGNSFKLFNAQAYAGAFAAIIPDKPGEGLAWDTDSLAVDGTLKVKSAVSLVPTPIVVEVTAGGLDLSWPATHIGWRLEAQTNSLAVGLSNNWVIVPGSETTNKVSIPYDTNPASVFFRLVYP